jgi:ADP-ribose pyrophosphatase YjhB (NUDIX family)
MPIFGVTAAVIDNGKVLLVKREDFPAWCLPGGGIEASETLAQAVLREVEEETGLKVELQHLVGVYSRPNWRSGGGHEILFAARPVGGSLLSSTNETLDSGYFDPEDLPDALFWWHRQPIRDALSLVRGVAWSLDVVWPLGEITRAELRAGLASGQVDRQELFRIFCGYPQPGKEKCEAGG